MFSPCLDVILWDGSLNKQQSSTRRQHYRREILFPLTPACKRADAAVLGQAFTASQPVLNACEIVRPVCELLAK